MKQLFIFLLLLLPFITYSQKIARGDGRGIDTVAHDATLSGQGTILSPLKVDTTIIATQSDITDFPTIFTDSDFSSSSTHFLFENAVGAWSTRFRSPSTNNYFGIISDTTDTNFLGINWVTLSGNAKIGHRTGGFYLEYGDDFIINSTNSLDRMFVTYTMDTDNTNTQAIAKDPITGELELIDITGDGNGLIDSLPNGSVQINADGNDLRLDSMRYFFVTPRANQGGSEFYSIIGTSNGLGVQVYQNGVGTGFTLIGNTSNQLYVDTTFARINIGALSTDFLVVDNRATTTGLEYDADYSSGYTDRTLPDWGNVNQAISDSLTWLKPKLEAGNVSIAADTNNLSILGAGAISLTGYSPSGFSITDPLSSDVASVTLDAADASKLSFFDNSDGSNMQVTAEASGVVIGNTAGVTGAEVLVDTSGFFYFRDSTALPIVGPEGATIYNSTDNKPYISDGSNWNAIGEVFTWYDAGNGGWVLASGTGVTFTRTSSTVGTFNIPSGVIVKSGYIRHTSAQNPGSQYHIRFDGDGADSYFTANDIDGLWLPDIRVHNTAAVVSNGEVATTSIKMPYDATTGTTNMRLYVTGNTTYLEVQIDNYNTSTAGSTGETAITFKF